MSYNPFESDMDRVGGIVDSRRPRPMIHGPTNLYGPPRMSPVLASQMLSMKNISADEPEPSEFERRLLEQAGVNVVDQDLDARLRQIGVSDSRRNEIQGIVGRQRGIISQREQEQRKLEQQAIGDIRGDYDFQQKVMDDQYTVKDRSRLDADRAELDRKKAMNDATLSELSKLDMMSPDVHAAADAIFAKNPDARNDERADDLMRRIGERAPKLYAPINPDEIVDQHVRGMFDSQNWGALTPAQQASKVKRATADALTYRELIESSAQDDEIEDIRNKEDGFLDPVKVSRLKRDLVERKADQEREDKLISEGYSEDLINKFRDEKTKRITARQDAVIRRTAAKTPGLKLMDRKDADEIIELIAKKAAAQRKIDLQKSLGEEGDKDIITASSAEIEEADTAARLRVEYLMESGVNVPAGIRSKFGITTEEERDSEAAKLEANTQVRDVSGVEPRKTPSPIPLKKSEQKELEAKKKSDAIYAPIWQNAKSMMLDKIESIAKEYATDVPGVLKHLLNPPSVGPGVQLYYDLLKDLDDSGFGLRDDAFTYKSSDGGRAGDNRVLFGEVLQSILDGSSDDLLQSRYKTKLGTKQDQSTDGPPVMKVPGNTFTE